MTNSELVKEFTRVVFNGKDLSQLDKYMREDYIQHNPTISDGREAFRDFAENRFFRQHPNAELRIMYLYEDGDTVLSHNHAVLEAGKDEAIVFDVYRIQDGKLAEHWDCIQALPSDQLCESYIKIIFG